MKASANIFELIGFQTKPKGNLVYPLWIYWASFDGVSLSFSLYWTLSLSLTLSFSVHQSNLLDLCGFIGLHLMAWKEQS